VTGQRGADTGANQNWGANLFTSEWIGASDIARFTRGDLGSVSADLSYAVVEFNGSNWKIQRVEHTFASTTTETESIPTALGSTNKAFLHSQIRHNAGLDSVSDQGQENWISSTTQVSFKLGTPATVGHVAVAWIIENTQSDGSIMNVQHISGLRAQGGE